MKKILVILLVLLMIPLGVGAEEEDYTDLWCSPGYECIDCIAFDPLEACDEYKRTHEPSILGNPVWDLVFDELGLIRPPEYPNIEKRLSVAADMLAEARQFKSMKIFWMDLIR